jgi:ATP-binding cassette subfamily G (WHITE) protein 2 (PDR)
MSRRSEQQGNLFDYEEGSDLDPFSNNFDAPKWTRQLASMREEGAPGRKAGLAYKNMSVHGFGSDAGESSLQSSEWCWYQKTVSNMPLSWAGAIRDKISGRKRKVQILNGIDGVLDAGEMLVVLGPPGSWVYPKPTPDYTDALSGCSTMLKTIAGEMNGIYLEEESELNYRGITPKQMLSQFRGEAIYTAEVDVHFPKLTVGDTLSWVFHTTCWIKLMN